MIRRQQPNDEHFQDRCLHTVRANPVHLHAKGELETVAARSDMGCSVWVSGQHSWNVFSGL
jgi:hypothetical protein